MDIAFDVVLIRFFMRNYRINGRLSVNGSEGSKKEEFARWRRRQEGSECGGHEGTHGLALIRFGRQVDELLRLKCKFVLGCVPPF